MKNNMEQLLDNLEYKATCAYEFDKAYRAICEDRQLNSLDGLWTHGTWFYFEQFDDSIFDDLKSRLGDFEIDGDQDNIDLCNRLLDAWANQPAVDWDEEATIWLLEEYKFYRDEYLQHDIDTIKAEI